MESVIEFISIIGAVIALFGVFDFFLETNHRNKLAEYIFGFHSIKFPEFETNVIKGLLNPFLRNGKLSYLRILAIYSPIGALIPISLFLFYEGIYDGIAVVPILFCIVLVASWPMDCWSLKVTNFLFVENTPNFPKSAGYIFVDVFLSFIPVYIMAAIAIYGSTYARDSFTEETIQIVFGYSAIASFLTSSLISLIQVIVLLIGSLSRFTLTITKINQVLAMNSRVHDYPLTFIGFVTGLILAIISICF